MRQKNPLASIFTDHDRWLRWGLLALTLAACAIPVSHNNADADLWGHVQYGRDVLRYGLPMSATYSFTAVGHPWINHENLSELAFAVIADGFGAQGLLALKLLAGVGMFAWMLRHQMRQGASLLVACGLTLLVALNLSFFWNVRPQLFSYLYFFLMLVLLEYCFAGWSGRWNLSLTRPTPPDAARRNLYDQPQDPERIDYRSRNMRFLWLAPLLMVLWTNTHGAFAAGTAIYLTYLACRGIEAWCEWRGDAWGVLRRLTMMGVAVVLATFLNPYGPRLHLWLLDSLGAPRPEITEWHPPNLFIVEWSPLTALMLLFFVSALFTRRSRDFTHLVILAATLWQTGSHLRHAPFFAIAMAMWMAPHVESVWGRVQSMTRRADEEEDSLDRRAAWVVGGAIGVGLLLLSGVVAQRMQTMTVRRDEYPVSAVQFMHDHQLKGKTIVTYNWAQYVLGCFGERNIDGRDDGAVLAFDGRFRTCYPQQVIDMHFDFVLGDNPPLRHRDPSSPPPKADAVLEYGRPELAVINRRQPHSELTLLRRSDRWVLLYQDEIAQVWGRRDLYDDPRSRRYLPPEERRISDQRQLGATDWPALPITRESPQRRAETS